MDCRLGRKGAGAIEGNRGGWACEDNKGGEGMQGIKGVGEEHGRKYDWESGAIGAMWACGEIIGGRGHLKRIWVWEEPAG